MYLIFNGTKVGSSSWIKEPSEEDLELYQLLANIMVESIKA